MSYNVSEYVFGWNFCDLQNGECISSSFHVIHQRGRHTSAHTYIYTHARTHIHTHTHTHVHAHTSGNGKRRECKALQIWSKTVDHTHQQREAICFIAAVQRPILRQLNRCSLEISICFSLSGSQTLPILDVQLCTTRIRTGCAVFHFVNNIFAICRNLNSTSKR